MSEKLSPSPISNTASQELIAWYRPWGFFSSAFSLNSMNSYLKRSVDGG